jgi:tRNA-2-methylthio-N6-dimethylallyladenosine synthase
VGFPGETEADFAQTLHVVREARFAGAFTFQYSKRPGTPAADTDGQVPKAVVQERYERLVELVEEVAWSESRALVGREVEVLVSEGEGRKDAATRRLSGRAPDNRLVHFTPDGAAPEGASAGGAAADDVQGTIRPGDLVRVAVTYAAPHHLVADGPILGVRRTRAGDQWEARRALPDDAEAGDSGGRTTSVLLGMPTVRP